MSFLETLFCHTFSHLKTVYTSTTGKSTKTLSTVSTDNRGRFEPFGGTLQRVFVGSVKNASHRLFTAINSAYEVGHIIEDADGVQYNIVSIENHKYMAANHHAEILLEERNKNIA